VHIDEAEPEALPSQHVKDAGKPATRANKGCLLDSAAQPYKENEGAMSIRDSAIAAMNCNYEHLPEAPQIFASTVHSHLANPGKVWQPHGGMSYLPEKFYIKLVRWIKLRRLLKFPVFNDDVLFMANAMAKDCNFVQNYKEGYLTNAWYYNFLKRFSQELGKAQIKTLEIDRERWGTADNLPRQDSLCLHFTLRRTRMEAWSTTSACSPWSELCASASLTSLRTTPS